MPASSAGAGGPANPGASVATLRRAALFAAGIALFAITAIDLARLASERFARVGLDASGIGSPWR
ncbi:MAG: hypothetical protein FJ033_09175 [Chloroflexi bacterium]|nr:hypothetical protein [Chloroflexota bacterium]